MTWRRWAWLLTPAVLAGCSAMAPDAQGARPCDRAAAARVLADGAGGTVRPYDDLAGLLPNVRYGEAGAVTDSVVVGRIVDVAPDRGFVESGRPGTAGRPGATVTTYDDPAATWRTVRVTVSVDEVLAGPAGERLSFDLALFQAQDEDLVECALDGLGRVVVLSTANPAAPEFLGIPRRLPDVSFGIATVGVAGALSFPFAAGVLMTDVFLAGTDTLEELRAAVRRPVRTVEPGG